MARKTRKKADFTRTDESQSSPVRLAADAQLYPDVWAQLLRLKVDGHQFDVRGREFQVAILRDESQRIVIPKGAQMGLTTVFLARTFHWMEKRRWHHLYLLPLKAGSIPFVQGRIDPIIDSNPHLKKLFKSVDNRMHKQTVHDIALRIRGTNIETELREIPADVLVMDERDKMVEDNIPEAEARLDGSAVQRIVELSTPTAPGHGVDSEDAWHASDQHKWYVPCPHCGRRQTFLVDDNVVIGDSAEECYLRCSHCKKQISDADRAAANALGEWVAENLNGSVRGYHINQLNSPTKDIPGFMKNYFLGLTKPKKMRAWRNNNCGEPFVTEGDQITAELLDRCIPKAGHQWGGIPNGPVYVGVDVGAVLHVRADFIDRWGQRVFWQILRLADKPGNSMWSQLDKFLGGLNSFTCVIDAHPEKSHAQELARKYLRRVFVGFEQDRPDQAEVGVFNDPKPGEVGKVTIDRTGAFDVHMDRLMKGRQILPSDARTLGEIMPTKPYNGYYFQLCQQAAVEEEDTKGRIIRRWKKNKNPDHWHHAEMFCEIAVMKKPYSVLAPEYGEVLAAAGGFVG